MEEIWKNARALRNNATDAERHPWRHLRGRNLSGFKFRRQYPIAGYVADFACVDARLVVELDGGNMPIVPATMPSALAGSKPMVIV